MKWLLFQFLFRKSYTRVTRYVPLVGEAGSAYPSGAPELAGSAYPSGAPEITLGFSGVRVARTFVFCAMFYRSLFVLLSFFFWPLCCLSFFDLRLLITPMASSNISYSSVKWHLSFKEQITLQLYFKCFPSCARNFYILHKWLIVRKIKSTPFPDIFVPVMALHTPEVCSEWWVERVLHCKFVEASISSLGLIWKGPMQPYYLYKKAFIAVKYVIWPWFVITSHIKTMYHMNDMTYQDVDLVLSYQFLLSGQIFYYIIKYVIYTSFHYTLKVGVQQYVIKFVSDLW